MAGPCFPVRLLSRCAPAATSAKHLVSAECLPPHITSAPPQVCHPIHLFSFSVPICHSYLRERGVHVAVNMWITYYRVEHWVVVVPVKFSTLTVGQPSLPSLYRDMPLWILWHKPWHSPTKLSHTHPRWVSQSQGHVSSQHSSRDSSSLPEFCLTAWAYQAVSQTPIMQKQ